MTRVEQLLVRGQQEVAFRTDLPLHWLVTTVYSVLDAAADDVNAGRSGDHSTGPPARYRP